MSWDTQSCGQVADHVLAKTSTSCEYLGHLGCASDERNEVFGLQRLLLHPEPERFNGLRHIQPEPLRLIELHERCQ